MAGSKTIYDCLEIFRYDWNLRDFIIRYLRKKIKIAQNGHNTIYEERRKSMCELFGVDSAKKIPLNELLREFFSDEQNIPTDGVWHFFMVMLFL